MVCINQCKCLAKLFYLWASATVLLWTVICLAIAVHLHGLLVTSDLSELFSFLPITMLTYC